MDTNLATVPESRGDMRLVANAIESTLSYVTLSVAAGMLVERTCRAVVPEAVRPEVTVCALAATQSAITVGTIARSFWKYAWEK